MPPCPAELSWGGKQSHKRCLAPPSGSAPPPDDAVSSSEETGFGDVDDIFGSTGPSIPHFEDQETPHSSHHPSSCTSQQRSRSHLPTPCRGLSPCKPSPTQIPVSELLSVIPASDSLGQMSVDPINPVEQRALDAEAGVLMLEIADFATKDIAMDSISSALEVAREFLAALGDASMYSSALRRMVREFVSLAALFTSSSQLSERTGCAGDV